MGKIFVIGLPRTGITSVTSALQMLDYDVVQNPVDRRTVIQLQSGDFHLDILKDADGISDIPAACYFEQYDRIYPGSKFILTLRDVPDWVASCERWWKKIGADNLPGVWWLDQHRNDSVSFLHTAMFGCWTFSAARFVSVYDNHVEHVYRHFLHSQICQGNLVVLDIFKQNPWPILCNFLQKPAPDQPFPHLNASEVVRA